MRNRRASLVHNTTSLHPIAKVTSFLATLDSNSTTRLAEFYCDKIDFIDPINEGRDLADLQAIFEDLFEKLDNISVEALESHGDEQTGFLKWVMRYKFRGKHRERAGVSYFIFSNDGKVAVQRDYWDAAAGVFSEFPGLGLAIRKIKKLVQIRP